MTAANAVHISLTLDGLSPDLQVLSFVGHEALDQPFAFDIQLVSTEEALDLAPLLHKTGCLTFGGSGSGVIHGLVYRIGQGSSGKRLTHYHLKLVPRLAYLRHNRGQKIFQQMSVPQIIAQVLEGHGILASNCIFHLTASYQEREYCTQYDESDLDFIQRLCEEEGIHFHFEHSVGGHVLVFGDDQTSFMTLPALAYHSDAGMLPDGSVVRHFNQRLEARTSRVTRRDYNFKRPDICFEGAARSEFTPDLEDYGYPGRFDLRKRGRLLATRALERHRNDYQIADGTSDEPKLLTGHWLPLRQHPRAQLNGLWLLRELTHEGKQPQVLGEHLVTDMQSIRDLAVSHGGFSQGYRNSFLASPSTAIYRPALNHPKRRIMGQQTAVVTGPLDEEIYCDEHGRVKVQFHWDREGQANAHSSCWIRVASGWAGNAYGGISVPRVGMEVLVTYLEGDPDQPVIVGCLFNIRNSVPYPLPEHKTRSTFKTLSSADGKGYNELRIEDRKGAEQIYLHAQRDWEQNIEHDQKIRIGNERHDTVEADVFREVKNEEHRTAYLDRKTQVLADDHLTISGSQHVKAGTGLYVEVGQEIHLCAGDKVVIEAAMELTVKAGGSFIKLDPAGITHSGSTVKINSGGAPGLGGGVQVQAPLTPGLAASDRAGGLLQTAPAGKPSSLAEAPARAKEDLVDTLEEEEEEVEVRELVLRIGVFFDGTGNNRSNSERAYGCFAPDMNLAQADEEIRRYCAAHGYDGNGGIPDNSYGNDVSNVARLYELYQDQVYETLDDDAKTASLAIYVEGIGTRSDAEDSLFSQVTGRGAFGVRARVEEAPTIIFKTLRTFQDNNPDTRVKNIEFDIFGFSRGAAAARDFANEVIRGPRGILAQAIPVGTPGLTHSFAWKVGVDVCINFIGIYDTVAAISNPWVGDLTGHNHHNPGINIHLSRSMARKIVHLVAQHERRYNFALNSAGAADIALPGAHSDLGGGYLPISVEQILLSKPRHSDVEKNVRATDTYCYRQVRKDLKRIQNRMSAYCLPLEIISWEVPFKESEKANSKDMKRVYAAVSSKREMRGELSLVYLRIMRQLAVDDGVPFREITEKDRRLALPADLITISEKLMAYALGREKTLRLTAQEEKLLFQRYVHISDHWNAAKGHNNSDLDAIFISRPDKNSIRTVHPDE